MEKVVVVGLGPEFVKCEEKLRSEYEITGIVSNDPRSWGNEYNGIPVGSIDIVNQRALDFVLLSSAIYKELLIAMLNANYRGKMMFLAITTPPLRISHMKLWTYC